MEYEIYNPEVSARRIKELRAERGMSQRELARRLGKTDSLVAKYENAQIRRPDPVIVNEIGKILDASTPYVLGWKDAPKRRQTENEKALVNDIYNACCGLEQKRLEKVVEFIKLITE